MEQKNTSYEELQNELRALREELAEMQELKAAAEQWGNTAGTAGNSAAVIDAARKRLLVAAVWYTHERPSVRSKRGAL